MFHPNNEPEELAPLHIESAKGAALWAVRPLLNLPFQPES
jgi:hypothetical protein